jgi:hypothetical protein
LEKLQEEVKEKLGIISKLPLDSEAVSLLRIQIVGMVLQFMQEYWGIKYGLSS